MPALGHVPLYARALVQTQISRSEQCHVTVATEAHMQLGSGAAAGLESKGSGQRQAAGVTAGIRGRGATKSVQRHTSDMWLALPTCLFVPSQHSVLS